MKEGMSCNDVGSVSSEEKPALLDCARPGAGELATRISSVFTRSILLTIDALRNRLL